MPHALSPSQPQRISMRAAVLDLLAHAESGETDEAQFLAALRQAVEGGRSRAIDLWESYRGGTCDARARLFARYAD